MDLFYENLTPRRRLNRLKRELSSHLYGEGEEIPENFRILGGKLRSIGSCALFIMEHVVPQGFMGNSYEMKILELCTRYHIDTRMITYSYLRECTTVSRVSIINSREFLHILVSIVDPVLIVLLGENTLFSFENRKRLLGDYHGKVVGYHNGVPLLLTYDMEYYTERVRVDRLKYRDEIMKSDWTKISNLYRR